MPFHCSVVCPPNARKQSCLASERPNLEGVVGTRPTVLPRRSKYPTGHLMMHRGVLFSALITVSCYIYIYMLCNLIFLSLHNTLINAIMICGKVSGTQTESAERVIIKTQQVDIFFTQQVTRAI